jgi:hypothetical protein
MSNRLPIPPELQQLIEKRELADRRARKADKQAKDAADGALPSQEQPPRTERRKKSRRKSDK